MFIPSLHLKESTVPEKFIITLSPLHNKVSKASTKLPVIQSLERVSRPGLRTYAKPEEFKRVKNGLGIAIISTSKGVMTDKEAKAQNVGGEILCNIY